MPLINVIMLTFWFILCLGILLFVVERMANRNYGFGVVLLTILIAILVMVATFFIQESLVDILLDMLSEV